MRTLKILAHYGVSAVLVWLFAAWMAAMLPDGYQFQYKARLLAQAVAILCCGLLFYPGGNRHSGPTGVLGWCSLLSLGLLLESFTIGIPDADVMKLTLAVFLLGLFSHSLAFLLFSPPSHKSVASCVGVCIFILLFTIPIWLGPWMEPLQGGHPLLFKALFWTCPLAYLAEMLGYDVLREQWFYQHTPFGMMRYEYPDGGWASVFLAGCCVWLLVLRQRFGYFRFDANQ